ncbi:hypothetical protein PIB30_102805, partial [Stylosanthes scabra]|nr:hypothetical protein [Stylosanthes scabra]
TTSPPPSSLPTYTATPYSIFSPHRVVTFCVGMVFSHLLSPHHCFLCSPHFPHAVTTHCHFLHAAATATTVINLLPTYRRSLYSIRCFDFVAASSTRTTSSAHRLFH